jgi:hypothetical protein
MDDELFPQMVVPGVKGVFVEQLSLSRKKVFTASVLRTPLPRVRKPTGACGRSLARRRGTKEKIALSSVQLPHL